jgi:hypothetical protein
MRFSIRFECIIPNFLMFGGWKAAKIGNVLPKPRGEKDPRKNGEE